MEPQLLGSSPGFLGNTLKKRFSEVSTKDTLRFELIPSKFEDYSPQTKFDNINLFFCIKLLGFVSWKKKDSKYEVVVWFGSATIASNCPKIYSGNISNNNVYDNPDTFSGCDGNIVFYYLSLNSTKPIACTEREKVFRVSEPKRTNFGLINFIDTDFEARTATDCCMKAINIKQDLVHGWSGNNQDSNNQDNNNQDNNNQDSNNQDSNNQGSVEMTTFMSSGNIYTPMFVGSMIQNNGPRSIIIQYLKSNVQSSNVEDSQYVQYVDATRDPARTVGLILDTTNDQANAKNTIERWNMGKSAGSSNKEVWKGGDLWFSDWNNRKNGNGGQDPNLNGRKYKIVKAGSDPAGDVATKFGVTRDTLVLYNPKVNFSTLQPGLTLCCSFGASPDFRPKRN
ncbi:hypothetical protein K502DRAFT_346736 [Neoconidiobolus thromboides FSU 785]|nr:hypothetical protein K502DRAFT_346736 [Neoconidiobolus thromboides FSU 785]